MPDVSGAENPKTIGFLDLSLELRDQIYRELLFQPIGYGAARRRHKFETSILRVNKHIHEEASRVLYEENAWVIFDIQISGMMQILEPPTSHYLFSTERDTSRCGMLPFGGVPSLRVRVREKNHHLQWLVGYVIIPLEWVGDMTEHFILGQKTSHDLKFSVQFHKNQKRESRQRMAIEFLEVIRGVRSAYVSGLNPPWLGVQVARQMKTPLTSIDELIDRTSAYIRRAELMLAQGQVHHAQELYDQGYENSNRAILSKFLANERYAKRRTFRSKLCESLEGSAVCSLRHGKSYRACIKLKDYVRRTGNVPDSQRVTGFYYYGLASVAAGFDNEALYGFMLALMLVPGYEAADKEVDVLEERVTKGMSPELVVASTHSNGDAKDLERRRICWNLDVLKPLRHRYTSDGELSMPQKRTIIANFWRERNPGFLHVRK